MGIIIWARGANANAGNSSLNVLNKSQTPTTQLEFVKPAGGGDLRLDFTLDGNGDPTFDPDTEVIVDGVQQSFTVEFSGTLPTSNKLRNVGGENLQGDTIVVISLTDGTEYVFLADTTLSTFTIMDDFPNGAFNIGNLQTTGEVVICFANGTLVDTPLGPRAVETLAPGDIVLTDAGPRPLRWMGKRQLSAAQLRALPGLAPIEIGADALAPGCPEIPVRVSANHRIQLSGWRVELMAGTDKALCAAKHLVNGTTIRPVIPDGGVTYHHLLFDSHRLVTTSGMVSESFDPGPVGLATLRPADRKTVESLGTGSDRPDLPTLRKREALAMGALG